MVENMASCWFSWIFHSLKIPICFYLKSKAKNIPQSISISLYKRPEELKIASLHTHTHVHPHSNSLLAPFITIFLALCFEVSFPSGFPFTSMCILPRQQHNNALLHFSSPRSETTGANERQGTCKSH